MEHATGKREVSTTRQGNSSKEGKEGECFSKTKQKVTEGYNLIS